MAPGRNRTGSRHRSRRTDRDRRASRLTKRGRLMIASPQEVPVSGTIELPVWLVGILAALALVGLLDRLLVPSVRWFLRRRLNEAIAELDGRLRLRIQPFKLTRRQSLIDRL